MPVPCPSHTTLNVSGHIIITSHSAWDKIEASLRDKYTDEWGYLKVNRDYRYFRHVIDCLQVSSSGRVDNLPADQGYFLNTPHPTTTGLARRYSTIARHRRRAARDRGRIRVL
jgi:hypothetical protein